MKTPSLIATLLASALSFSCLATSANAAPNAKAPAAKTAAKPAAPKASGPLRAYKGPEGEMIVMVEVNEGKEMLVHLRKVGGDLDGKSLLYLLEDRGDGNKDVYVNKKRGSKTYRSVILTARNNRWDFYYPDNHKVQFSVYYSEAASEKVTVDEVLAAYKP